MLRRLAAPWGRLLRPAVPMMSAVLVSPAFRAQLHELAARLGRSFEDVVSEAADSLNEMSASHDALVMRQWNRLGGWMIRGYDRLLDEEGLARLRSLDAQHSLAFLIAHRSYLDEWALPPALVEFGVEPPFGFAGANLDFFPLGSVARRTGIVHIRRSTSDVPVYKLALRAFMRELVSSHANLIWSIEGGRSRTGKLRPPRFGLLRYVVDGVDELDSAEVLLVPVSILYDQLPTHEVDLMTSEALGQGKRPEDARWFLAYVRGLRKRLGRVYVDFGEAIPLRQRLAELRAEGIPEDRAVERVALEVCHRINLATPVTPTAAVCIALLAADRALSLDEILTTVAPLARYLEARTWPTAGAANLTDRATVRRAVQDLVHSGVLTSFRGQTTVWGVGPRQHLTAAVYRNSAIHVLVHRAILELVIAHVAEQDRGRVGRQSRAARAPEVRVLLPRPRRLRPRAGSRARARRRPSLGGLEGAAARGGRPTSRTDGHAGLPPHPEALPRRVRRRSRPAGRARRRRLLRRGPLPRPMPRHRTPMGTAATHRQ
jgi:glycerol-3-phosphate O-acyltransferase